MDFCVFSERIIPAEVFELLREGNREDQARKGWRKMDCSCGGGMKFTLGMATGMVVGAAVGMVMAPSQRQMKRAANKAAKKVGEAVDMLTDALDL